MKPPVSHVMPRKPAATGEVRVIGGRWRGTRLPVPEVAGLRPSADRVRETVFNWLQFDIAGLCVLDAYAGSGALGFEAASRGASSVTLVERDRVAFAALQASCARLKAEQMRVVNADVVEWLREPSQTPFDLAFVDPPFAVGLQDALLARLIARMSARSWLYLEQSASAVLPPLQGWVLHREGATRDVRYTLLKRQL